MKNKPSFHLSLPQKIILICIILVVVLVAGFGIMLKRMPSVGAYGADLLRDIIGQEAVANMEMMVFNVQDAMKKISYSLNLDKASDPWDDGPTALPVKIAAPTIQATTANKVQDQPSGETTLEPTPTPVPTWVPAKVTPLGDLENVGEWQPYITNAAGKVVAYRTALQPDSERPYAIVAVVAFNLEDVKLHFQVGFEEPYAFGIKKFSDGTIPAKHLKPDVLLAVFNGGFKYEHGTFGCMLNDNVSIEPTDGMATFVIYKDGHYRMGEWGKNITRTNDMQAFRQNGPLVIEDGVLNPKVDDPSYWGYTITGATVAWRSGIALDKDVKTLYYFIGPYLTIDMLAKSMEAVNVWDAMQLDINNYWTIFEAFPANQGELIPQPLLPKDMNDNVDRFLRPYARDFFYLTDATLSDD